MFNLEKKSPGMKWGDMIDPINYLKFCHVEEALGLFLAAQPSGGSYWEPSCCSIAVNFLTRKLPELVFQFWLNSNIEIRGQLNSRISVGTDEMLGEFKKWCTNKSRYHWVIGMFLK